MGKRGRGYGAVYWRPDGRWEGQIRISGGGRRSFYARTRREVIRRLTEARWALGQGLPVSAGTTSLATFFDRWLAVTRPRLQRALVWARVDGANLERLQASRQALRLIFPQAAQRRIWNILEPVIDVRVPNQPDLGDALDANQVGAAERPHRPGDVFSTCQARVGRSGCGEPRRAHRRS